MAKDKDTEEKIASQLLRLDENAAFTMEEVERISNSDEVDDYYQKKYIGQLYSLLVFSLTHERYGNEEARKLWLNIKGHRKDINKRLGRDVGIAVAALDYMTNIAKRVDKPKIINEGMVDEITEYATQDGLTGLYAREVFDAFLDKLVQEAERYDLSLSLIMIDVDDFKKINDKHGHKVGDEVLQSIGTIIKDSIRQSDVAARYGGEELAVILPNTDLHKAIEVAERIRDGVYKHYKKSLNVTVSIGVTSRRGSNMDKNNLLRDADKLMYRAKAEGKNKVISSR